MHHTPKSAYFTASRNPQLSPSEMKIDYFSHLPGILVLLAIVLLFIRKIRKKLRMNRVVKQALEAQPEVRTAFRNAVIVRSSEKAKSPATSDASLNSCQLTAIRELRGTGNIFLTGSAGSGKSFLIQHFLQGISSDRFPIVASTGAAAVLIGGRTFHSFFGLKTMAGGPHKTAKAALQNGRLIERLKKASGIIIDEISMISGEALHCAEMIARGARGNDSPWGGLRMIAVGDFAQLPPVTKDGPPDWAFQSEAWERSHFRSVNLKTVMRTKDPDFLRILNLIRVGEVNDEVLHFLREKTLPEIEDFEGIRLFPTRAKVDHCNDQRLRALPGESNKYQTAYFGAPEYVKRLKKDVPIPDCLLLKEGALVMLRKNDPERRWVNGSLGIVQNMSEARLDIRLTTGLSVELEPESFS